MIVTTGCSQLPNTTYTVHPIHPLDEELGEMRAVKKAGAR
jgi:hypothetical protein